MRRSIVSYLASNCHSLLCTFYGKTYWEKFDCPYESNYSASEFRLLVACAINPFIREIKNFRMGDWFDLL